MKKRRKPRKFTCPKCFASFATKRKGNVIAELSKEPGCAECTHPKRFHTSLYDLTRKDVCKFSGCGCAGFELGDKVSSGHWRYVF